MRHTTPSFFALAFQNGWEDWNANRCNDTSENPSTAGKNLVNFGPEFKRQVFLLKWVYTEHFEYSHLPVGSIGRMGSCLALLRI